MQPEDQLKVLVSSLSQNTDDSQVSASEWPAHKHMWDSSTLPASVTKSNLPVFSNKVFGVLGLLIISINWFSTIGTYGLIPSPVNRCMLIFTQTISPHAIRIGNYGILHIKHNLLNFMTYSWTLIITAQNTWLTHLDWYFSYCPCCIIAHRYKLWIEISP